MDKDEPATFNINLLTGDITTVPSVTVAPISLPIQTVAIEESYPEEMLPPLDPDVPSSSGTCPRKIKPPRKSKEPMEKSSVEYITRRQRNNVAVRKSREKTRERSKYTLEKIEQLKVENEDLESKISTLTKELSVLKDLFMDHARGFCTNEGPSSVNVQQLERLLGVKVKKGAFSEGGGEASADTPGTSAGASTPRFLIGAEQTEEQEQPSSSGIANITAASFIKDEPEPSANSSET